MTNRPRWKTILLTMLCLAGLIAVIGGSYAAYTSQTFQRGVVRNRNIDMVRFTSNYLQSCANSSESYANRMIYFQEADQQKESISFDIDIYNYAIGNNSLVSQKDITYDLEIKITGGTGDYKITYDGKEESLSTSKKTTIKSRTMTGRWAKIHTYTITMPGKDLNKAKFTVIATPQNLSATNNQKLAAVVAPCIGSVTTPFQAEGKFVYNTKYTPDLYDGFNYEVSISSGTATGTLTWDSSIVEIDPYFLSKLGIKTSSGEISFQMNQTNGTGDYLIPFYIKDKTKIPKTWDKMNTIITFTAEQTQE